MLDRMQRRVSQLRIATRSTLVIGTRSLAGSNGMLLYRLGLIV